jgi:RNA recognition motif-containing protein
MISRRSKYTCSSSDTVSYSISSTIDSPLNKVGISSPSTNFAHKDFPLAARPSTFSSKPGSGTINTFKLDSLRKFDTVGRRIGRDLLRQGQENRPVELDLFSIFVGGLDVTGTAQWTEEKLTQHFSRYGAVENVKLIMPSEFTVIYTLFHDLITYILIIIPELLGRMGFAFIKFKTLEGARRAVNEEVCQHENDTTLFCN